MNEYVLVPKEDVIAHHGIKGQQWGERNGPPYPLKRGSIKGSYRKLRKWQKGNVEKVKNSKPARKIKEAREYQKKNRPTPSDIHAMSDQEIQERTQRLEAERNLYNISQYGKSNVEKILVDGAKEGAKRGVAMVVAGSVAVAGAAIIAKKTGVDISKMDMGKRIWEFAKPGKK